MAIIGDEEAQFHPIVTAVECQIVYWYRRRCVTVHTRKAITEVNPHLIGGYDSTNSTNKL